ncbi:MAG: hypothetical protein LUH11_03745 [Candidatus Gastranaerophilales bacterium]|nr:hypothetical protein [Candidatus Gastranaerophilales bacterium]
MSFLDNLTIAMKNLGQNFASSGINQNTNNLTNNFDLNPQIAQAINSYVNNPPLTNNITNDLVQNGTYNSSQNITNINQNEETANKVANALQNSNQWNDKRRIGLKYLGDILTGIGQSSYNSDSGVIGSLAKGIANGNNLAQKDIQNYQGYKNAKQLYEQNGLDPSSLSINGDYSNMTPDKLINIGIQQRKYQVQQDIANAKDQTSKAKMIFDNYSKGLMSADEAQTQLKLYGIDINNLQESNDTRKTNSQIALNDTRSKQIEASISQNNQKIAILKQKVAQGSATANDKAILNKLNIENKQLIIKQNELINQSLENQLNNGVDTNNYQNVRPVGSNNNNFKGGWAF